MTWLRHYVVVLAFLAAVAGLAFRVSYLTVTEGQFLAHQGDARSIRSETIEAHRGGIYDRHGEVLALSTPVRAAWTDPSRYTFSASELERIAAVLELPVATLNERLGPTARRTRQFAYLKRQLNEADVAALTALEIDGLFFRTEYRRFYPAAEVAAHVVGNTSVDDLGLEGIELAFDRQLSGQPGNRRVLKDRRGNLIDVLSYGDHARFGMDLTLSIDLRLQYLAYRELKAAVQDQRAVGGSLVMLDARSGEVLAMVNQPSYNPNEPLPADYAGQRNIAVTDTFEPGSTVKPFTVLAALEAGTFEPGTVIDTHPGYLRVGNKLIEDPVNRGKLTLTDALARSSQVAIAKVALALEPRAVFDVLARAGLGAFIGTGLPGEAPGRLTDEGLDSPLVRSVLAYGYGLAVSPLQLAQAYLTLATGGVYRPVTVLRQAQPEHGQRVFAAAQTRQVLGMMEAVTAAGGTAPEARLAHYRVAGKTGTARKLRDGAYNDDRHVALFAGIAPASAPRIVMIVIVDEPNTRRVGGGATAAPIFAQVADQALKLLGAAPDLGTL